MVSYSAGSYGTVGFERGDTFTAYDSLTEAQVIAWVKDKLEVADIEAGLQAQIDAQEEPNNSNRSTVVMGIQAFTRTGNTVTFLAATTAPTAVQAVSTTLGGNQYRIINAGSVTVFLGYGADGASANSNAAVITTTGTSIPLLPGTDEILSFVPNAYFTGITASSNATIYVTPGDGS
jgi:hypothetical protein